MDRIHIFRYLLLWPSLVFALPQPQATATSSSAFPSMSAQDGVGVSEGGVGSTNGGTVAGADGSDQGGLSISKGAIVGMSIGIGIIIIAIATLWFFWYMAKKRSWDVRKSIRRASRRLTGRKPPSKSSNTNRRGTIYTKSSTANKSSKVRDLEAVPEGKMPSAGWLADEKERSRSRSPDEAAAKDTSSGGWKSKLGFGKR